MKSAAFAALSDCRQSPGLSPGIFLMGRDPVEHAKRAKYKPPAMRVRGVCYTKKSPFRYNKVVQANL